MRSYMTRFGADEPTAALAALAAHPFVSGLPKPHDRVFVRRVRRESRRFVFAARRVRTAEELLDLAQEVVLSWVEPARRAGDRHYYLLFLDAFTKTVPVSDIDEALEALEALVRSSSDDLAGDELARAERL